jgi:SrtB family sortase
MNNRNFSDSINNSESKFKPNTNNSSEDKKQSTTEKQSLRAAAKPSDSDTVIKQQTENPIEKAPEVKETQVVYGTEAPVNSIRETVDSQTQKRFEQEKILSTAEKRMKIIFGSVVGITLAVIIAFVLYLLLFRPGLTVPDPSDPTTINEVRMFSAEHYFDDLKPNEREDVEYPAGIQEKMKRAYATDKNFVSYFSVPGTCMDMAVYQANDNDFYIKKDLAGNYSRYGTVFLDYRNDIEFTDRNTIIYGHNFDNNKDDKQDDIIFGDCLSYLDVEYYKQRPLIEYDTLTRHYTFKIIACMLTNGDSTGDVDNGQNYLFNYIAVNMSNECFMEYIDELLQRSFIHTGVDVIETDKLLTLSTCQYEWDVGGALQNARCVLVARMVREGESVEVDTSKAVQNENPRMPHLYYKIFGGENPYYSAEKWYPY